MTKEQILKQLDDAENKYHKLLLTLIKIQTKIFWDANQIRYHIKDVLNEIINANDSRIPGPDQKADNES